MAKLHLKHNLVTDKVDAELTSHTELTSIGNYNHSTIDDHIDDSSIHQPAGRVLITAIDNESDYLNTKIAVSGNITKTVQNSGLKETLLLTVGTDADTLDGSHASAFSLTGHTHTGLLPSGEHTGEVLRYNPLGGWEVYSYLLLTEDAIEASQNITIFENNVFLMKVQSTGAELFKVYDDSGGQLKLSGLTASTPLKADANKNIVSGAFGTSSGQFAEGNHTHTGLLPAGSDIWTQPILVWKDTAWVASSYTQVENPHVDGRCINFDSGGISIVSMINLTGYYTSNGIRIENKSSSTTTNAISISANLSNGISIGLSNSNVNDNIISLGSSNGVTYKVGYNGQIYTASTIQLAGASNRAANNVLIATDTSGNTAFANPNTLSGGSIPVYKSADEAVSSSTTLQDDNHLTASILASAKYTFRACLMILQASNTADLKFKFTVPTSCAMRGTFKIFSDGTNDSMICNINYDLTAEQTVTMDVGMPIPTNWYIEIDGVIDNSTNAGAVTLQWTQGNSSADATTMKKYSSLILTKV